MSKLVLGAFSNHEDANQAINELEDRGVQRHDFSIIMQDQEGKQPAGGFRETLTANPERKVAAEVTAGGAAIGGLAGLTLGTIATAGMLVAGPVVLLAGLGWIALTTIAGGAVGAAAGGIVGALMGLGIPKETATHHESIIKQGGVLLGASDNDISATEIREVLEDNGAEHIATVDHAELPQASYDYR